MQQTLATVSFLSFAAFFGAFEEGPAEEEEADSALTGCKAFLALLILSSFAIALHEKYQ